MCFITDIRIQLIILLTFNWIYSSKRSVLELFPSSFWFSFSFSQFKYLDCFRSLTILFRNIFIVIFYRKKDFLCLLNVFTDVFRAQTICLRGILWDLDTFRSFFAILVVIFRKLLYKNLLIFERNAEEHFLSSRLISYKVNGFKSLFS